jgi:aspartate racemase
LQPNLVNARPTPSVPSRAPETPVGKHIGIIGTSPEGTALCYREIFRHAARIMGDVGHPTVSIHNEPFELYLAALMRNDWHAIGDLLRKSADALAKLGAGFCILPDNVLQHGSDLARAGSSIPWLNMTEIVANKVADDGRKTVGVVGTKMVMFGSTYQTHLGLKGVKVIAPLAEDGNAIDHIIFSELVHGECSRESEQRLLDSILRLKDRGAEAIVLASSEVPLAVSADNSPLPVYDPVDLLAEGAIRRATA